MRALIAATVVAAMAAFAVTAEASAPPVGPLPASPLQTISTTVGSHVSVALPHGAKGRVWRVARPFDGKVVAEATEGDVGAYTVVVFTARAKGATTITFAQTLGERAKAYKAARYRIVVR